MIEVPPPQVIVTEHVYLERRCPDCGKRCVPALDLGDQVTGPGRFGHRLTSLLTYLREEGHDGYIWTASTLETSVFRYGTRQKTMVDTILGDAFGGIVVSDLYAASTHDERMHQYCWAHLWQDLEELFTFVTEPGVPPTNNAAERSLRHLVIARKISGGSGGT